MKKNIIIIVLSISTVIGFTLAYSQFSRVAFLEEEAQRQKEITEKNMKMAIKAQEEAERLQELAKNALDRARSAERSAITATQDPIKSKVK